MVPTLICKRIYRSASELFSWLITRHRHYTERNPIGPRRTRILAGPRGCRAVAIAKRLPVSFSLSFGLMILLLFVCAFRNFYYRSFCLSPHILRSKSDPRTLHVTPSHIPSIPHSSSRASSYHQLLQDGHERPSHFVHHPSDVRPPSLVFRFLCPARAFSTPLTLPPSFIRRHS